jgi:hypothetical protein
MKILHAFAMLIVLTILVWSKMHHETLVVPFVPRKRRAENADIR